MNASNSTPPHGPPANADEEGTPVDPDLVNLFVDLVHRYRFASEAHRFLVRLWQEGELLPGVPRRLPGQFQFPFSYGRLLAAAHAARKPLGRFASRKSVATARAELRARLATPLPR